MFLLSAFAPSEGLEYLKCTVVAKDRFFQSAKATVVEYKTHKTLNIEVFDCDGDFFDIVYRGKDLEALLSKANNHLDTLFPLLPTSSEVEGPSEIP